MLALRGAIKLLPVIEVIFSEVTFRSDAIPVFRELANVLAEKGFEIYEIASIGGPIHAKRLESGDVIWVKRSSPLLQNG